MILSPIFFSKIIPAEGSIMSEIIFLPAPSSCAAMPIEYVLNEVIYPSVSAFSSNWNFELGYF